MNTKFKDLDHHQFYEGNIRMTHSHRDPYRQALFYLLGLTEQTRQHIRDLYDYEEGSIRLSAISESWQTGTTVKLTRLAFNLYNGYNGDEQDGRDNNRNYSPYFLFDTGLLHYIFEAIQLRYPEYAKNQSNEIYHFPLKSETGQDGYDMEH